MARTMFMEFTNEQVSDGTDFFDLDSKQFMLGPNLLVSPVLEQGVSYSSQNLHHQVYFPDATFYNLFDGT